ncbi:hypothetical protein H0A58_07120 [Alcaligenaceae bacterium]|nr:hypothetical protein [Alcaligenaceae bacterium]
MTVQRERYLGLLLLVLALGFKQPLTRSMSLHMLVHIPLILAAGWFMGGSLLATWLCRRGVVARIGTQSSYGYNEQGIPGLLLVLLVSAWWMLPRSLDDVLMSSYYDVWKFISVFLTGMVVRDSIARANRIVLLFFLGNFCWMTAIVGLLYQEHSSRLCNFYLLSDQEQTGLGLVILAIALPLVWLFLERDRVKLYLRH